MSRKNPFRRNIMLVDDMKVENVDKFYDEIDKSKLASPVIVRGPMSKIVSFIEFVFFAIYKMYMLVDAPQMKQSGS